MDARVHSSVEIDAPVAHAPRIAVIVPAYGVAHLVGEALASLQAQTFEDWECCVIDDGAPDDVATAVAPFLDDSRITLLETGNHGVSAARNTAIAHTSAPLVALLDGDDLLRPDYLAKMVGILETDPYACLVTCNARVFGTVPREYLVVRTKQGSGDGIHGSLADVLDRSFNVYIGSAFRRADFDRIGGFDAAMAHSEDFDFWVRLMALGGHAVYVPEVLGDYRVRRGSASADSSRMYRGNIATYRKLLDAAPDAPESELLKTLISGNEQNLAIEHAIDRVISGDTQGGLSELKRFPDQITGRHWDALFLLWRLLPVLAKPMLTLRQTAHARGADRQSMIHSLLRRKAA